MHNCFYVLSIIRWREKQIIECVKLVWCEVLLVFLPVVVMGAAEVAQVVAHAPL